MDQRMHNPTPNPVHPRSRSWYWLLVLPYLGLLFPSIYARATPELAGVPFFYWYQFAWVILGALLTALVYWRTCGTEPAAATEAEPDASAADTSDL